MMKILTIDEVAKILKINKATAYRYAKTGAIPAFRIGGSWRINEDTLSEWLTDDTSKRTGVPKKS